MIKKALKKASTKSDMEKIADDILKDAMLEIQNTGRTADKILKAKIMRQESAHTLRKIRELDDEFDDGEEEEEEPQEDIQDMLVKGLMQKFLGGNVAPVRDILKGNNNGASGDVPPSSIDSLKEVAKNLTPEQIEALKQKFLT